MYYLNYKSEAEYNALLFSLEKGGYYWNGKHFEQGMGDWNIPCPRSKGCFVVCPGMGVGYSTKPVATARESSIHAVPTYDRSGYCF